MSWFTDLLQGIPVNAVLKERLALAEQKFKDLESENKTLKEQVAQLQQANKSLQDKIDAHAANEQAAEKKPNLVRDLYQFDGDEGLFCTFCYDSQGKKVRTTALLGKVRKCPNCKAMYGR